MVVILVVLLFAVFMGIDFILERRRAAALRSEGEALQERIGDQEPRWVAGFRLPEGLHYHQGHTWVHWVGPELAYIGVDDFARRLIGPPRRVRPPSVGAYVHQGEPAIELERNAERAELLSPVSGEIVGVNQDLTKDPGLLHRANYGRGWIYKIRSPELFKELSNLLDGTLARKWIEDTRDRFQHRLMLAQGSVIQDGGHLVDDLSSSLEPKVWRSLVDEFLLQEPIRK